MFTDVIKIVLLVGPCVGFWFWGRAHPEAGRSVGPYVPYVLLLAAVDAGYLGFAAHERRVWWWVSPVIFVVLAIYAFVRQRRMRRADRSAQTP